MGIQGCNCFASVVGSVRACTGTEGVASSKFGLAKANDRLKGRLKDTILIYLVLTSFLRFPCIAPHHVHASPTVPPVRPMHVCFTYALVKIYLQLVNVCMLFIGRVCNLVHILADRIDGYIIGMHFHSALCDYIQ